MLQERGSQRRPNAPPSPVEPERREKFAGFPACQRRVRPPPCVEETRRRPRSELRRGLAGQGPGAQLLWPGLRAKPLHAAGGKSSGCLARGAHLLEECAPNPQPSHLDVRCVQKVSNRGLEGKQPIVPRGGTASGDGITLQPLSGFLWVEGERGP